MLATPLEWVDYGSPEDASPWYTPWPSALECDATIGVAPPDGFRSLEVDGVDGATLFAEGDTCEPESWSIQIANPDPRTTREELSSELIRIGGAFETLDKADVEKGVAQVRFFDLRANRTVRASRLVVRARVLIVQYGPLKAVLNRRNTVDDGTAALFPLRKGPTDKALAEHGEIQRIRGTAGTDKQRFVEYWDTRWAERAKRVGNGKRVLGSRIVANSASPASTGCAWSRNGGSGCQPSKGLGGSAKIWPRDVKTTGSSSPGGAPGSQIRMEERAGLRQYNSRLRSSVSPALGDGARRVEASPRLRPALPAA